MKPALRLGSVAFAMFLFGSVNAEANVWDWLEALDGPGPSDGRGNFMANLLCSKVTPRALPTGNLFRIPDRADARATCLVFDQRWFHAGEDDRFHPVDISITEIGASVWLHPAVELGATVGRMHFSSENEENVVFEDERWTISYARLVLKPLLAPPMPFFRERPGLGFLQFYVRETVLLGSLTQNDFASKPGTQFERKNQRLTSMGFIIDVPSLLRLVNVL